MARPSWVNLRSVLGLLLFAIAFLAGQRALEGARTTVPVWRAARDLAANTELSTADLAPVDVKLPVDLLEHYAGTSVDVSGGVLTRPVRAGELIPLDWISRGVAATAGRTMTIPLSSEPAAGGALREGDRVDVLATFDAGDTRARTIPVVREVEVVELITTAGLVVEGESLVGITMAVTPQESARLAFAVRTGEIDIARVETAIESQPAAPVRAGDFD
ncbi:MAG: RcpC/CpaB family pilus assembly protein [Actinomycetota bacterium]